jgi:hypothetical protein
MKARLQMQVGGLMFPLGCGRRQHERGLALAVEQDLQLVRLLQALNVLVAVPGQADLDLVVAVLGEVVRDQGSAARADRQSFDVLFLGDVRPDPDRVAARRATGASHGQAADLLRRGEVAIQQRGREVAHRHVIEPATGLVVGKKRRRIDVERQEVADGVLVLGAVEPSEGVGPAGLRMLGGRAVEGVCEQSDERVVLPPRGTNFSQGRHLACAQFPDGLLPGGRVAGDVLRTQDVERQPRFPIVAVVAGCAIKIHELADRLGLDAIPTHPATDTAQD